MGKIYGYARISQKKQSIDRQIRNILENYPTAIIKQEAYTGTTTEGRKEYAKLKEILKKGDTVVFDSVSRMSRNADEGIKDYEDFMDKGIELVFLKEPYVNTMKYKDAVKDLSNSEIETKDIKDVDTLFKFTLDKLQRLNAERDLRIAFEQAEKEVKDLQQRTKEGLQTTRAKGTVLGRPEGKKSETKKSKEMKEKIQKLSKDFNGNLKDTEIMELLKIARNSYYKYKREITEENISK